ncbi:g5648 [Coccomyxa viridis]|uniref:G5648 protein n=1 Tax=Coccomyxa viridis TaxID=1274662 RepID=A0ABP1FVV6_9CHLO
MKGVDLAKEIELTQEAIVEQKADIKTWTARYDRARTQSAISYIQGRLSKLKDQLGRLCQTKSHLIRLQAASNDGESSKNVEGVARSKFIREFEAMTRSFQEAMEKACGCNHPGLGASLEICGSDPQEADVLELLRRLPLCHFGLLEELYSPCCVPEAELSKLQRDMTEHLTPLQWGHEGRLCRQRIGLRWLGEKLCLDGTVVIPVHHSKPWIQAAFPGKAACMEAIGIDFLIAIKVPITEALAQRSHKKAPTPDELKDILKYVIGAYQLRSKAFVESNGLVGVWPKAMMQAIGLNEMAEESGPPQWILVFAGDLNRSLAIHRHKAAVHAVVMGGEENLEMDLRFMRHLLGKAKEAKEKGLCLTGNILGEADSIAAGSPAAGGPEDIWSFPAGAPLRATAPEEERSGKRRNQDEKAAREASTPAAGGPEDIWSFPAGAPLQATAPEEERPSKRHRQDEKAAWEASSWGFRRHMVLPCWRSSAGHSTRRRAPQ